MSEESSALQDIAFEIRDIATAVVGDAEHDAWLRVQPTEATEERIDTALALLGRIAFALEQIAERGK